MIKFSKSQLGLLLLAIVASIGLSWAINFNLIVAFAILILLFIILLIINNFEIGIILVLLSTVAGQLIRLKLIDYGGSILLSDILAILVGFVYLARKLVRRDLWPSSSLNKYIGLFIFWTVISLIYSTNLIFPIEALKGGLYLVRWFFYIILFFIILDSIKDKKTAQRFFNWSLAAAGLIAILGFIQYVYVPDFAFMRQFGWDPHSGRLLSTFFDPNFVGGFLTFVLTVILGVLFFSRDKKMKLFLYIIGAILFIALILTFSRSAYLGFLISFLTLGFIKSWKIALIGLLLIAIGFFATPKSIDRIKSAWRLDESASARIVSWQQGWEIISDHSLIGIGFDNLPYMKSIYGFTNEGIAHSASGIDSSLLTLWATTGFIGLIIYLGLYFTIGWQALKNYLAKNQTNFVKGFSLGFFAALVGLLIESQFVNSWFYPPIMIILFIFTGILFSFKRLNSKVNSSNIKS